MAWCACSVGLLKHARLVVELSSLSLSLSLAASLSTALLCAALGCCLAVDSLGPRHVSTTARSCREMKRFLLSSEPLCVTCDVGAWLLIPLTREFAAQGCLDLVENRLTFSFVVTSQGSPI
jgi:hypothetical protein